MFRQTDVEFNSAKAEDVIKKFMSHVKVCGYHNSLKYCKSRQDAYRALATALDIAVYNVLHDDLDGYSCMSDLDEQSRPEMKSGNFKRGS